MLQIMEDIYAGTNHRYEHYPNFIDTGRYNLIRLRKILKTSEDALIKCLMYNHEVTILMDILTKNKPCTRI